MILRVTLGAVLCVILLYVLHELYVRPRRRLARRSSILKACRAGLPRILVLVHAHRAAVEAADTVFHLFERARCPLRVVVAILQEAAPDGEDVWHVYATVARRHRASPVNGFTDSIRVVNRKLRDASGPLRAYAELFEACHTCETRVVMCAAGAILCDGWDSLVEGPGTTVSHVPAPLPSLRVRSTADHAPLPPGREIAFPTYRQRRSVVSLVPVRMPLPVRCQSIAVSARFCVVDADLFHRALAGMRELPPLALYASDYFLSAVLHEQGATFEVPSTTICYESTCVAAQRHRPSKWGRRSLPRFDEYARFSGATHSRVSGRAKLGLLPDLRHGTLKYGSASGLERVLRPYVGED